MPGMEGRQGVWPILSRVAGVALAGMLMCAWDFPDASPVDPAPAAPGTRILAPHDERVPGGPLIPLAIEACRHGMDYPPGMDPSLRRMLGYDRDTAFKRVVRQGDTGELRWLFMPATHCTGKELVGHSATTLLLMHAFEYETDDFGWTAYYFKAPLSGELAGFIYGIYGAGRPQFMNIGGNDDQVQAAWESEKRFWLSHLP
jgi:hypothetical protein